MWDSCGAGAESANLATADYYSFMDKRSQTSHESVKDSGLPHGIGDLLSICERQEVSCVDSWPTAELDHCPLDGISARGSCTHVDADLTDEEAGESASQIFKQWLKNNPYSISLADLRNIKLKTSTIESAIRRLGGGKKGLMHFVKFVLMWVQNCHMRQSSQAAPSAEGCDLELGVQVPFGASRSFQKPFNAKENFDSNSMCTLSLQCGNSHLRNTEASNNQIYRPSELERIPPVVMDNGWDHGGRAGHGAFCPPNEAWFENDGVPNGSVAPRYPSRGIVSNSLDTAVSTTCASKHLGESCDPCVASRITMLAQWQRSGGIAASTTQAARKSRMERQRRSFRRRPNHKWCVSSAGHHHSSSRHKDFLQWPIQQLLIDSERQCETLKRNLRLLFYKELKQSDVGGLGRIVLPKKAAETCLPHLESRDGVYLAVEDFNSSKVWNVHYRFWPNNKSRMYLFENIGDFVKSYSLKEGDYMLLYFNPESYRYMLKASKVTDALCSEVVEAGSSNIIAREESFNSGNDMLMTRY